MLAAATAIFAYYTFWVFILPFVDSDSKIQSLFPPRDLAIKIPALLLLVGITVVGSFIGLTMVRSGNRAKASSATRKTAKQS